MANDWESALRKLTRRPPNEGAKTAVRDALYGKDSDRGAALIMAALVDASLIIPIALSLGLRETDDITNNFWNERGLFSSFDARSQMVGLLGILGEKSSSNIRVIRLVRNAFAHAMSEITFASSEIERACSRLHLSETDNFFVEQIDKDHKALKNRQRFGRACDQIYQGLLTSAVMPWVSGNLQTLPALPILP